MKALILSFVFASGLVHAAGIYDRTTLYSDLNLQCADAKNQVKLEMTVQGPLLRERRQPVTVKVTSEIFDTNVLAKGQVSQLGFFYTSQNNVFGWGANDAFNFVYDATFDHAAIFKNAAKSKATLRRTHTNRDVGIDERHALNCTTQIKAEKLDLQPITLAAFKTLEPVIAAAILAEATSEAHWDLTRYFKWEGSKIKAEEQMKYRYFAETAQAFNHTYPEYDAKPMPAALKAYAEKMDKTEEKEKTACIDDFFENTEADRDETLGNWNVCSYQLFVVADSKGELLGAVSVRHNDNGVDDSDGHTGATVVYDSLGREVVNEEWSR